MLKLFNDTILDLSAADETQVSQIETRNKNELTTFLAKVATITREARADQNTSNTPDISPNIDLIQGR